MKIKPPIKTRKGIVFAGCSFTWGQGLYYYSNLSTIKLPKNENKFDKDLITYAQYKFLESVRFPRIVADYFNTFELVRIQNGGANHTTMHIWGGNLNHSIEWLKVYEGTYPAYHPSEISTFVCQFTEWTRSPVTIEYKDKIYGPMQYMDLFKEEIFFKWLENNKLTLEQYTDIAIQKEVLELKSFLQKIENKGINVAILTWPNDLVNAIKNDQWLNERFIELEYKNNIYSSIHELYTNNSDLIISNDCDFFITTPKDHHPSLKCHQIIAKNIINFLEKKEYNI